ncbi:hypothetical protein CH289_05765 [Rhodococcus sp. RS1C4]|nr:hypothetical protein [Rhodococcus sp. RS1C4]OZC56384.1 hypothetical protein CH289_05765 [Rhodococcus sp. RS1C4]
MRIKVVLGAGALTVGLGVFFAPTASAQDAGFSDYPCSDQFAVPWSLDAWTGERSAVISPYGTADIRCSSFHGQTSAYQLDPQGRKHLLNPFSILGPTLYIWDINGR